MTYSQEVRGQALAEVIEGMPREGCSEVRSPSRLVGV